MAKTKINTKALKGFQDKIIKRKTSVSKEELAAFGIDSSISTQEFGNILLKKDFFGLWEISLKNDLNDLDGNPISENKKLFTNCKSSF